jgi:hypothetical protein
LIEKGQHDRLRSIEVFEEAFLFEGYQNHFDRLIPNSEIIGEDI